MLLLVAVRPNSSDDAGAVEMTPNIEHGFAVDVGSTIDGMGNAKDQEVALVNRFVERSKFRVNRWQ
jgi:hypothetical protein